MVQDRDILTMED